MDFQNFLSHVPQSLSVHQSVVETPVPTADEPEKFSRLETDFVIKSNSSNSSLDDSVILQSKQCIELKQNLIERPINIKNVAKLIGRDSREEQNLKKGTKNFQGYKDLLMKEINKNKKLERKLHTLEAENYRLVNLLSSTGKRNLTRQSSRQSKMSLNSNNSVCCKKKSPTKPKIEGRKQKFSIPLRDIMKRMDTSSSAFAERKSIKLVKRGVIAQQQKFSKYRIHTTGAQ